MKVTKNLKNKLMVAKARGYTRVYSVIGAYRATTYISLHDIDDVLAQPTGYDYGCQRPYCQKNMWSGVVNTRHLKSTDIMYSRLFRLED